MKIKEIINQTHNEINEHRKTEGLSLWNYEDTPEEEETEKIEYRIKLGRRPRKTITHSPQSTQLLRVDKESKYFDKQRGLLLSLIKTQKKILLEKLRRLEVIEKAVKKEFPSRGLHGTSVDTTSSE